MQAQCKTLQATQEEKSLLFLMSEFYKIVHQMNKVQKTIVLYDVYEENDKRVLMNLQSVAAGITSDKIELLAIVEQDPDDDEKKIRYNDVDIKKLQAQGIIEVHYIKVHLNSAEDQITNIRLYDAVVKGEKIRVVTVPIEKSLTEKKQNDDIASRIKKFDDEKFAKSKALQGGQLNQFLEKSAAEKDKFTKKFYYDMKQKHYKMFMIEALLYAIRSNTKKISVCGITSPGSKDKYQQFIETLFEVPVNARQFIIHTITNQKRITEYESKNLVSSLWSFKGDKITCKKNECFNDIYFTTDEKGVSNFKTKIYKLMNEGNNKFLAEVIENFIRVWTGITFSSSICIASVLKKVFEKLQFEEDLSLKKIDLKASTNVSTKTLEQKDPTDQKQDLIFYSFSEIFQKYGVKDIKNLRTNNGAELQEFFTKERLGNIETYNKQQVIPKEIENLIFVHYFYQINQQFCQKYATIEKVDPSDTSCVFQYLKTISELVQSINKSNESESQEDQILRNQMQKYFDFLDFLFQSTNLIKTITDRQTAISGSLKVFFDQLRPKENRLLNYIHNNQDNIKPNQQIHYYELYLKIIRQCSKGEHKIEFIYLLIHLLKADKISSNFSYDKRRCVQAIKSYSEIIHQFDNIPEAKRDRINKLDIEKKIARLLILIGHPDEAVLIYQKNHLIKSAEKCLKHIVNGLKDDKKSKKYIEFGKYLESELSFPKAIDYYQNAYQAAKSTKMRQEAIQRKISCVGHIANIREDEKRIFVRFYENKETEEVFSNTPAIELGTLKQQNLFSRLRNRLGWDESNKTSVILDEQIAGPEEPMIA